MTYEFIQHKLFLHLPQLHVLLWGVFVVHFSQFFQKFFQWHYRPHKTTLPCSFSFRRLIPLFKRFIHFNWLFLRGKSSQPQKSFSMSFEGHLWGNEVGELIDMVESQIGQLCKSCNTTSMVPMNPTDYCGNEAKYCQWLQYSSSS